MVEKSRGDNGQSAGNEQSTLGSAGSAQQGSEGTTERDDDGLTIIDPAHIGEYASRSQSAGSGEKRGRGRPRKNKQEQAKASVSATPLDLSGLGGILLSIHQMLAGITKTPEFALEEYEAQKLAEAGANVAKHYNITASDKALAWTNLAFCMGSVYGARIAAIGMRKKTEKAKKTNGHASGNAETPENSAAGETPYYNGAFSAFGVN